MWCRCINGMEETAFDLRACLYAYQYLDPSITLKPLLVKWHLKVIKLVASQQTFSRHKATRTRTHRQTGHKYNSCQHWREPTKKWSFIDMNYWILVLVQFMMAGRNQPSPQTDQNLTQLIICPSFKFIFMCTSGPSCYFLVTSCRTLPWTFSSVWKVWWEEIVLV